MSCGQLKEMILMLEKNEETQGLELVASERQLKAALAASQQVSTVL